MTTDKFSSAELWNLFALHQSAEVREQPEVAALCAGLALNEALNNLHVRLFYESDDFGGVVPTGIASTYGDWIVLELKVKTGMGGGMLLCRQITLPVDRMDTVPALRAYKLAVSANRLRGKQRRRDFSRSNAEKSDDYLAAVLDMASWDKILGAFTVYQDTPELKRLLRLLSVRGKEKLRGEMA